MTEVIFYKPGEIDDALLRFAVIMARMDGQWIFCRHKARTTWEIPGGHREPGEEIADTARRELWEETGAADADICPLCVYGVEKDGGKSYGMLFLARVQTQGMIPAESEIAETRLYSRLPENLSYPEIQPALMVYTEEWMKTNKYRTEEQA